MTYNSEAVLWPDVWIYWKGFTAIVWGSMDLTDVKQDLWKITDNFFFIDYSRSFGPVNCSVGYGNYSYPGYLGFFPTTGEIYGKVGGDFVFLQASLAAYFDVKKVKGLYIAPEISRSFSLANITFTPLIAVGYADKKHNLYYFYAEKSAFTDLLVKIDFSYSPAGSLGNFLSFNGNLNFQKILDNELANAYEDDNNFWWGIGISLFFGGE